MFGFDLGPDSGGEAAPPTLRPETAAVVQRMATCPASSRLLAMDALVGALLEVGVWQRLDSLIVLAAHDPQSALLNWRGVSSAPAIGGGSPLFVPDRGFYCDGLDDWIDSGLAPASGAAFQQNDAMVGAWFRKSGRNANSPVGTITVSAVTLNPRGSSDASASRLNGSTAVSGGVVASGYGFTAVDRQGTALRQYAGGTLLGTASAASSSRSAATIGLGRANNLFADGQFCAFAAGASLTAAQHQALHDALQTYLLSAGVASLPDPVTRTLPLAGATALPDGSAPTEAGRGMAATGLVRRPDGRWYVGNGTTTRRQLLFTRMSADLTVAEAEFTAAGLGFEVDLQGSCQGMTLDTSDGTIWFVVKLSGASGDATHLVHFDPAIETVIGSPAPVAASDTGVAYDPGLNALWITRDLGSNGGQLLLYSKQGSVLSAPTSTPGGTDQCFFAADRGELLVTAGANGSDGAVHVYARSDYGGMVPVRIDTLAGADAIEGIVAADGHYHVCNDAQTHPGAPALDRVLRYAF